MTQNLPPSSEGQIKAPNAIELFWERNRRTVNVILVLLILVVIGNYGWRWWRQREIDRTWGAFAAATALDKTYTTDGSARQFLEQANDYMRALYYQLTQGELITSLPDQIKALSKQDLDKQMAEAKGTSTEPLLVWILAQRAFENEDFGAARAGFQDLQNRFPTHFLCQQSEYPVQWRFDRNADKEKDKKDPSAPPKKEKPDLEAPAKGSLVASMLTQLDRIDSFRKANERFYKIEEPDATPTVVVKTTVGEFKIRLYSKFAPEHCKNFLKRIEDGFYTGMYVDQIKRSVGRSFMSGKTANEMRFGLASAKQDDRSRWSATEPSSIKLAWEESNLSHFPGMVAAEAESDRKQSSGDRVWINATDAAQSDGDRVIFGRVVEGLEIVKQITEEQFSTLEEGRQGSGKPQRNIQIESMTVLK